MFNRLGKSGIIKIMLQQEGKKKQLPAAGLTLLEVMVSLGIFLFIVAIIWLFIRQSYSVQSFTLGQTMAISEAQRGVERLVKEAREALPADTGAYPIEKADDFEFIFFADYDRDAAIERVRYYLDGSNFYKGVIEPTGNPLQYSSANEQVTIISRYVRNTASEPVFKYYDGSYSGKDSDVPLTTPANISQVRLVHINLRINVDPNRAPTDYYLESDVQIRNLKDNL